MTQKTMIKITTDARHLFLVELTLVDESSLAVIIIAEIEDPKTPLKQINENNSISHSDVRRRSLAIVRRPR